MKLRKWYRRPSALILIPIVIIGAAAVAAIVFRNKPLFALWLPLVLLYVTLYDTKYKEEDREDAKTFIDKHFNEKVDK